MCVKVCALAFAHFAKNRVLTTPSVTSCCVSIFCKLSCALPPRFLGPSSTEVVRLAMDIGALSVRGNHDHEVVRQGLKFRHRSADSQDRDRDRERDRESREREKERDNSQEKDRGNSGTSAKSRPSIGSVNGTGGGGGAVTTSASEAPGGRSMSSRVQQHLELGMQYVHPFLYFIL